MTPVVHMYIAGLLISELTLCSTRPDKISDLDPDSGQAVATRRAVCPVRKQLGLHQSCLHYIDFLTQSGCESIIMQVQLFICRYLLTVLFYVAAGL